MLLCAGKLGLRLPFLRPSIHPIHFPINTGNAECLLGADSTELLSKLGGPVPELEEAQLHRDKKLEHR